MRKGDAWGLIAGAILLILVAALFGRNEDPGSPGLAAPAGSSLNQGPDGLSAIYQVLAEEGLARRWQRPPGLLAPPVDVLVLWNPEEVPAADWADLLTWVSQGRRLVVAAGNGAIGDLPGRSGGQGDGRAVSAAAGPETAGVGAVETGGLLHETLDRPLLVHLATADGRSVLVSWPEGQGRVYWSADLEWLTNARIAQADNLQLALGVLTPPPGGQVAFDEYHHGFAAVERWYQVLRGPLLLLLAQAALALAAMYWAYGVRFGSPRALPAGPPRAAVEYVQSMGLLYQRARARPAVLAALHGSLRRELGRLLGNSRGLAHDELARRAAAAAGVPAGEIMDALDRTSPEARPQPAEAELLLLGRRVEELRRRMRGAGYRDGQPGAGRQ